MSKMAVLDMLIASSSIICLQETDHLSVDHRSLLDSLGLNIIESPGPNAGVCIMMNQELAFKVKKKYFHSVPGRAVGVLLETDKQSILFVSVYMPTGLDWASLDHHSAQMARDIYSDILLWSQDASLVFVAGDLNETLSSSERTDAVGNASGGSGFFLRSSLLRNGFRDCFRHLYPSPACESEWGFTCFRDSQHTRSRIDYILTKGEAEIVSCEVQSINNESDHYPIVSKFLIADAVESNFRTKPLRIPNLHKATDEIKIRMCNYFDRKVSLQFISSLQQVTSTSQLDQLAQHVNDLGWQASKLLPLTGGKPGTSVTIKSLSAQRRSLSVLRSLIRRSETLNTPSVRRQIEKCRYLGLQAFDEDGPTAQSMEASLSKRINQITRSIRREVNSQRADFRPRDQHNFTAHVHQMLSPTLASGNKLTAVVDPISGKLTQTPNELKKVLFNHFAKKFAEDPEERKDDPAIESLYDPQPNIDSAWYHGLMAEFTPEELTKLGNTLKSVAAPADDKVGAGIWKILLQGSKSAAIALSLLFNACLRLRHFPKIGRSATIVPLLKKQGGGMELPNIRPISLQNSLMKIFSKGLAMRLAKIFAKHDILHPAQEAFLKGGSTGKCIDTLLDIWEDSNLTKKECISIFYDLAGAYDTVPHDRLLASLDRIKLPPAFVELISSSLSHCTARVRTAYGPTPDFPIGRSIKQGDPLAPLLFIIFMDPLHCGLDQNPLFDGRRDGYMLRRSNVEVVISSKGYADDTNLISGSLEGAKRMNQFTERWCLFNGMQLNGPKTEAAGCLKGKREIPPGSLVIAGSPITPKKHDEALRHLGVLLQFNLEWNKQISSVSQTVGRYCTLAVAHRLSVAQCVSFFEIFLHPKLEYVLRFVHCPESAVMKWNQLLSWAIFKCSDSAQRVKMWSLEELLGITLVSTRTAVSTISESFLRLNESSRIPMLAHTRLPHLARGEPVMVSKNNRLTRTTKMLHELDWSIETVNRRRTAGLTVQEAVPRGATSLNVSVPLSSPNSRGESSEDMTLYFNYQGLFRAHDRTGAISLYTDGSAMVSGWDMERNRFEWNSSYSVVVGNTWMQQHYQDLPDEHELEMEHLSEVSAIAFRSRGECHENAAYFVELAAITRAVMAVPMGVDIDIYTDSLSSIQAIKRYEEKDNDRQILRTAGRPFLGLISQACKEREGRVRFHHIRSHTNLRDIHSTGNKIADHVADSALASEESQQANPWLQVNSDPQPIPLHLGERNVAIRDHEGRVVAGDMRRAVEHAAKAKNVLRWKESESQGRYAGPFYKDLRKMVLGNCLDLEGVHQIAAKTALSRERQLFMLNAASDTMHFTVTRLEGKRIPHEKYCESCDMDWQLRSTQHLFECRALEDIRQKAADAVMAEVRCLLPEERKADRPDINSIDSHGPHNYVDSFSNELVCLVAKLMRRDEENKREKQNLINDADVVRACFGGYLTWEMKAVLRRVAGVGRGSSDDIGEHDRMLDRQIEQRIDKIRHILFDSAFACQRQWNRMR